MKKILIAMICLVISHNCYSEKYIATENTSSKQRPKVVVLTSRGGNGHMTTCDILKDLLPNCELKLIRPIHDFFQSIFDEEEWYGSFLKNGWIRTGNFIARYPGPMFFKFKRKSFEQRLVHFLEQEKPDLLISVIPLINGAAALAAKRCKIPFMLITLDADLELWLSDMERCKYLDFTITVQTKTPRIEKQIKEVHLPISCLHEVGRPLRKDFFTAKNSDAIRKEWSIPLDKDVIMLMRGSTGSNKIFQYVKRLMKIKKNIHLLVCIGRNTSLIPKLKKLKNDGPVTFSIVPFTPKIPDLMAVSNLLITQPSPNVCNEAMHMHLPILVDMTTTCLFWEKATLDWINIYNAGESFKYMSELNKSVIKILENKNQKISTQQTNNALSFNSEIYKLVYEKINHTHNIKSSK